MDGDSDARDGYGGRDRAGDGLVVMEMVMAMVMTMEMAMAIAFNIY